MRRRFDDAVIQSYRAPPPLSSLFFLVFLFFSFLRPPSLPSPSSSSARASYFERGIRGRNRKRHGRASNRYSIAVSPRTGPSLSAGSTISNSIENSFFLPFLWKYFFRTKSEEFFFLSDSEVKKRK